MSYLKNNESDTAKIISANGMFLTNRQVSCLTASIVFAFFLFFMVGYYLGQKKIIEQVAYKIEQDSLSDKIYASMFALYDSKGLPEAETLEGGAESEEVTEDDSVKPDSSESQPHAEQLIPSSQAAQNSQRPAELVKQYYAQLAGFGTYEAALACVTRINRSASIATIKKHRSVSAKGKVRYWYQVVTKPYSRDMLDTIVKTVQHTEHLKDVRIVAC